MSDFEVKGAEELAKLGKALKSAGAGKDLRKELLRNLRAAGKPVTTEIKSSLRSKLPQKGGLAADMSKARIAIRNRLSANNAGIRIDVKHAQHDITRIDRGQVRHPVFGHKRWVTQQVEPNLVSEPVDKNKPEMQQAVLKAMGETAAKIERSA